MPDGAALRDIDFSVEKIQGAEYVIGMSASLS